MLNHDDAERWLLEHMAADLAERLSGVRRSFGRALILGFDFGLIASVLSSGGTRVIVSDTSHALADCAGGVVCDEDRLPFADESFDLVISLGVLDTVDDLPGALVLIRRTLKPGGLFLAALPGAGGLQTLKTALGTGDGVARFHPQIDARSAGDLLSRAGFALPVAEVETVEARYRSLHRLFGDLRANGFTNALRERHYLPRNALEALNFALPPPFIEQFSVLTLTGWKPDLT